MKNFLKTRFASLIGFAVMAAVMLVLGGGQAFAQGKLKIKPHKWFKCMTETTPYHSAESESVNGMNFRLIKQEGPGNPCIEMRDGKMRTVNSSIALKDVAKIKTTGGQYVEFVIWYGSPNWDDLKAKRGSYWRVEPNSTMVFLRDSKGNAMDMYIETGAASKDTNYVTVGEAVEFAEIIVDSLDFNKIKSEFNNLKNAFDDYKMKYPKLVGGSCPMTRDNSCPCGANLLVHMIEHGVNNASWLGFVSGALPTAVALPAEYFTQMAQYRLNAKMAYLVALNYGRNPTKQEFQLQMYEMFADLNVSKPVFLGGLAGAMRDEMIEKAATAIAAKIGAQVIVGAIPVAGQVLGPLINGLTSESLARKFADAAKEKYKT